MSSRSSCLLFEISFVGWNHVCDSAGSFPFCSMNVRVISGSFCSNNWAYWSKNTPQSQLFFWRGIYNRIDEEWLSQESFETQRIWDVHEQARHWVNYPRGIFVDLMSRPMLHSIHWRDSYVGHSVMLLMIYFKKYLMRFSVLTFECVVSWFAFDGISSSPSLICKVLVLHYFLRLVVQPQLVRHSTFDHRMILYEWLHHHKDLSWSFFRHVYSSRPFLYPFWIEASVAQPRDSSASYG